MLSGGNFSSSLSRCTLRMTVMMMMVLAMMSTAAAMPKGAKGHKKASASEETVETVPLQLDPTAFAAAAAGSVRPLHNVSISPWTYNVTHDNALFPPMVSEAHCLLHGCLDALGREDLNLRSRPIMHQVLVLRRVRSAGGAVPAYHYRLESRLVAVGCTCVRPSIQVQH